ncbi:MAG TPA: ECF transporter S component, partial [Clostridia bacterium]|nr:ECF transporter S component [Clostridia bacterium]
MDSKKQIVARIVEWSAIALVPCVLLLCARYEVEQAAILTLFTALFASIPFFLHFEQTRPKPRDIMPIVVMAALATTGQILFAPIPSFKPIGAIVIVTAIAFGR